MSMPGLPEMLIIIAIAALLFGSKKLPELGGAIGESIKNFKKGLKETETAAKKGPSHLQPPTPNSGDETSPSPRDQGPT
jgi:sec-independent protein translocase protein TatA